MIDFSSNEAASLVKLAVRGVSYPWGVAEESAFASRWFAEQSVDGLAVFAGLFSWADNFSMEKLGIDPGQGVWCGKSGQLCPLMAGCAVSDFASQLSQGQELRLENVAYGVVLLPFIFLVSKELQTPMVMSWHDGLLVCDAEELEAIASNTQTKDHLCNDHTPKSIVVKQLTTEVKPTNLWPVNASSRVHSDVSSVHLLKQFAHRTYAPATEQSRLSGAGAGTTDND